MDEIEQLEAIWYKATRVAEREYDTNKSAFAVTLFHTMINLSPYLLAIDNVNFKPFILAISLTVCTATILLFWQSDN